LLALRLGQSEPGIILFLLVSPSLRPQSGLGLVYYLVYWRTIWNEVRIDDIITSDLGGNP
jgi:hypothetical protein